MKDSLSARPDGRRSRSGWSFPGVPPGSASSPRANHRLSSTVMQEKVGHRPRKETDDELFRVRWHRFIFLLNLEEEAETIYLEKRIFAFRKLILLSAPLSRRRRFLISIWIKRQSASFR